MDWKQFTGAIFIALVTGAILGIAGTLYAVEGRLSRLEVITEKQKEPAIAATNEQASFEKLSMQSSNDTSRIEQTVTEQSGGSQPSVQSGNNATIIDATLLPPPIACRAKEQGPLAQTDHNFPGPVHIVQLWRQNGQSPWGTKEVMALIEGDVSIVETGGNTWTYPSVECKSVAEIHMQDGARQRGSIIVTEQELRDAGLIR